MYKKLLLSLAALLSFAVASSAQIDLNLTIQNLSKPSGKVLIGFFTADDPYLEEGGCSVCRVVDVSQLEQKFVIEDVPEGEYSIAILHDLNDNNEMDYNWIGIPREGYGFSSNPKKIFRKPTFEETKVYVSASADLTIKMVNW